MRTDIIYNKSSLDGLQEIDDNSIKLLLSNPPCPQESKDDQQECCIEANKYVDWISPILKSALRILHPTGAMVLVLTDKIHKGEIHPYIDDLKREAKKIGFKFVDDIIWLKTNSFPNVDYTRRPIRAYEHCLWFVKEIELYTWNADNLRKPYAATTISRYGAIGRLETLHKRSGGSANQTWIDVEPNPMGAACNNVLCGSRYSGRSPGHPDKLPNYLPEWFISGLTDAQDIVFDPFTGSGTILAAAKEMNRRYIGYEISKVYYERAEQELQHAYTEIEIDEHC